MFHFHSIESRSFHANGKNTGADGLDSEIALRIGCDVTGFARVLAADRQGCPSENRPTGVAYRTNKRALTGLSICDSYQQDKDKIKCRERNEGTFHRGCHRPFQIHKASPCTLVVTFRSARVIADKLDPA